METLWQRATTGGHVAERVDQRALRLSAQLSRVPTLGWLALLVTGGILAAVIVSVVGAATGGDKVSSQLVSLPPGATSTALPVRYQVVAPADKPAQCEIDAVGKDFGVVGTLIDKIPARADGDRTTTRSIVVRTSVLAVSANIINCKVLHTP
jgi:hypothetical protein